MNPSRTLKIVAILAFAFTCASGQGKPANDPLTGSPLYPGIGGAPNKMPDSTICKSKMQANFYDVNKAKTDDVAAWYSAHLSGFKKFPGYDSQRAQIIFRNADGTILVVVTGERGAKGQNVDVYSISYQHYQPGLAEKSVQGITFGNIVCVAN